VRVVLSTEVLEAFGELPVPTQRKASDLFRLVTRFPRMFRIRKRGLLRGYRFFEVDRRIFYYEVSSTEVRIIGILPGMMRGA